jgi:carboxyl-terminal processing protease
VCSSDLYWVYPNDNIAYLNLTSFSGDSPGSMARILSLLKLQGMQGLVLDLRNNSGGYLSGAIAIANDFLKPKSLIVSARGRDKRLEELAAATAEGVFDAELPLVVLVNSISASASEIVSGALKDHRRAVVIGTRTYGKGSVQRIWQLAFGDAQMKMTTAYYYLPLGRRVHRDPKDKTNEDYGVVPDIKVELTPKQIETYFKQRRQADILHRDDLPEAQRTWKVYDVKEMVDSDPQLDMGLMVLRGKILKQQVLASQQHAAESVVHSNN